MSSKLVGLDCHCYMLALQSVCHMFGEQVWPSYFWQILSFHLKYIWVKVLYFNNIWQRWPFPFIFSPYNLSCFKVIPSVWTSTNVPIMVLGFDPNQVVWVEKLVIQSGVIVVDVLRPVAVMAAPSRGATTYCPGSVVRPVVVCASQTWSCHESPSLDGFLNLTRNDTVAWTLIRRHISSDRVDEPVYHCMYCYELYLIKKFKFADSSVKIFCRS